MWNVSVWFMAENVSHVELCCFELQMLTPLVCNVTLQTLLLMSPDFCASKKCIFLALLHSEVEKLLNEKNFYDFVAAGFFDRFYQCGHSPQELLYVKFYQPY